MAKKNSEGKVIEFKNKKRAGRSGLILVIVIVIAIAYFAMSAIKIVKLCDAYKIDSNTVFQIKKSSSSVFANITEAQYPQSLADMHSKFEIARKECAETESWLKLIFASGAIDEETFKSHRNLCGRIKRILTASCITIENKLKQGK